MTFNAAFVAETIHQSKSYGFSVEKQPHLTGHPSRKRDDYILRLNGIYERNLTNDKVDYLHGWARLLSRNQAEVTLDDGSKVIVNAKKILVAVGGNPTPHPNVPGAELGTNSDGFFDIDEAPQEGCAGWRRIYRRRVRGHVQRPRC